MRHLKSFFIRYFPQSVKDWLVLLFTMGLGFTVCIFLQRITETDTHVPIIFVLIVLLTALMTTGYFYGILASVASVFAVNWAFTFPYFKLDFSLLGYPLTFVTMLGVSIAASMLTTGMKETEKLRRESEAEKMRANLLRSVSHDLRTPLTAISGSISVVLDSADLNDQTRRELLENAKDDADWLIGMVENLLSITKISGQAHLNLREELIEDVVGESIVKFRKSYPEIQIEVEYPPVPVFVPMDVMLIEQVIRNLLDNAVTHGKTTERIHVKMEDDKDSVNVYIRDNGQGIPDKLLPHLFDGSMEPGKDAADSTRFMGIGLAVSQTIIKAHGGIISADNVQEGGAEFRFSLPKKALMMEES